MEIDISTGDTITPKELNYEYISIFEDKKIYIETGMMKKCEDVERVIKEKGYLQVKIK